MNPTDTIDSFRDLLLSFGIFPDPAECNEYVQSHYERIIRTVRMLPPGPGKLLEIGGSPYCMTLMLQQLLDYEMYIINFGSEGDLHLVSQKYGKEYTFPCAGINVETEDFPYNDNTFDVVVCAELIEHLTFCPTWMLDEIHRVLAPDGILLLSTPNVLRYFYKFDTVRELLRGRNLYDTYSGYGPYGRHNREYTPDELRNLVEGCGFQVKQLEVCDIPDQPTSKRDKLYRFILSRIFGVQKATLDFHGAQIFLVAKKANQRKAYLPNSLYKCLHAQSKARKVFPRIP